MQAGRPRAGGAGRIQVSAARGTPTATVVPSHSTLPRSRLLSPLRPVVGATVATARAPVRSAGRGGSRARGAGRGSGPAAPGVAAVAAGDDGEPPPRIQVSVTVTKDRSDINLDVYTSLFTNLRMDDRLAQQNVTLCLITCCLLVRRSEYDSGVGARVLSSLWSAARPKKTCTFKP